MKNDRKSQGVTLLELLVALAIFSIIAVIAYSGLSTLLTVRSRTDEQAAQLAHLQMAFSRLGQDIGQIGARSIRNEYGDRQPAVQGTPTYLEFSRLGWRNPLQQPRSSIQRVAYFVEDDVLWRVYWSVLDRAQDTQPLRMELLTGVRSMTFRFLGDDLKWYTQWPLQTPDSSIALAAIEVTLVVPRWGTLVRLFQIVDLQVYQKFPATSRVPVVIPVQPSFPRGPALVKTGAGIHVRLTDSIIVNSSPYFYRLIHFKIKNYTDRLDFLGLFI